MPLKTRIIPATLAILVHAGAASADSHVQETEAVDSVADKAIITTAEELADEPAPILPARTLTVAEMLGMFVVTTGGEDIGEVDYVIDGSNGTAAVIGIGGFLGLGEYTVAIDTDNFRLNDEGRLELDGLTADELKALPEFDETDAKSLADETEVEIRG